MNRIILVHSDIRVMSRNIAGCMEKPQCKFPFIHAILVTTRDYFILNKKQVALPYSRWVGVDNPDIPRSIENRFFNRDFS